MLLHVVVPPRKPNINFRPHISRGDLDTALFVPIKHRRTVMQEANRWRWLLNPEVVVLIIIPTAWLIPLGLMGMLGDRVLGRDFWISLMYMRFFGWQVLHLISFVGFGYLAFSAISYFVQRKRLKLKKSDTSPPATEFFVARFQSAKSFAWLVVMYGYALTANVVAMNALCRPDPKRVEWANDFLMRVDYWLFGSFVPFKMHEYGFYRWLSPAMLFCYLKLSLVLSIVLVALFIFKAPRFRQYILAFVMIMYLCMPGWAAVPATCPGEAYRTDKLQLKTATDIDREIAYAVVNLDSDVTDFCNRIEPCESNADEGRFAITAFPSLHIAWGVMIVWFGVELYQPSIILLLPWGLLNCVGAIFSLQHYAIDAPTGIVVAIAGVYLVRWLISCEAKRGLSAPPGYELCKFIQKDIVALGHEVFPSNKPAPPIKTKTSRGRK